MLHAAKLKSGKDDQIIFGKGYGTSVYSSIQANASNTSDAIAGHWAIFSDQFPGDIERYLFRPAYMFRE